MKRIFLLAVLIGIVTIATIAQDGVAVKLKGQIVCESCWSEAPDRKQTPYGNAADITCAEECAGNGLPRALAVEDDKGFTLYTLERGAYKTTAKAFLELVPKFVEIEGTMRSDKEKRIVKVNKLKVLADSVPLPRLASTDAVLSLKDLTGNEQSLANYKGRVVVLNFWATWCIPCQKEMPDLSAIQNDHAALGVQVIGAAGDEALDAAKVMKFVRQFKVNFPVWLGASTSDMARFGVGSVLPATAIIDRDGKIVWRKIGVIDPVEIRKELDKLLQTKAGDAAKTAKAEKPKNSSLVPA